ncbi:hypothetical protein HOLleu_25692 [Holothuria leucospilota]|uniref:Uncharacterized protein n=1 Tax=Holothuria leucospilota TaxID=206669 RepID=A0A9Q1BS97_HOLLE|nr:hypothetical protein HOLleu_25692 [Holothuria leucospilota]
MATTYQDYVFFQTTEMTSQNSDLRTGHHLTEGPSILSLPWEITATLDVLIIAAAMVVVSAIVVLLFLLYRYQRYVDGLHLRSG